MARSKVVKYFRKMKNKLTLILFVIFFSGIIKAQVGYVPVDDEIYLFLERMNNIGVISDYNSFELPKTRKTITSYLDKISENKNKLDKIDTKKLEYFILEFEYDKNYSLENSLSLLPNLDFNYLFADKEKYLYSYIDSSKTSLFVNFIGELDYLNNLNNLSEVSTNSTLYKFGGEITGTIKNKIGFKVKTTNGSFFGNKNLAQRYSSLKYNYKFTKVTTSEIGKNFFDETEAYLFGDFDFINFKIGNDRKLIGHGIHKTLLSDNPPRMEYLSLNLQYKSLGLSFFHGKLLGNQQFVLDPIQGGINKVSDKYLVYHRLSISPSKHFQLGIGEMIIYANRNIDLSYLNPFNFYKSIEHSNQDRDNTMLFFDFQNNSIDKLKFYSTILIDDIDFGKIGTGWYGNQTLISFGIFSSQLYNYLPIDFELQYIKIDPYVFTHRISNNNFTNLNFSMGSTLQPNSSSTILNIYYRPYYKVNLSLSFTYSLHGANVFDNNNNLTINYGGDILLGHRVSDSEKVFLLKGDKEIYRITKFTADYEPVKNWIFSLNINYFNNSLAGSQHSKEIFTSFTLSTKL